MEEPTTRKKSDSDHEDDGINEFFSNHLEVREISQEELDKIINDHNLWLMTGDQGKKADLKGVILRGMNLRAGKLSRADFAEADLSETDLSHLELSGANFQGAKLVGAKLAQSDLGGAILIKADLRGANLEEAYMAGAKANEANLENAILIKATLSDTTLEKANLQNGDLFRANLHQTDLTDANLKRANLGRARLEGAVLTRTKLIESNLSGANLSKAILDETDLQGCNLTDANLQEAKLIFTDIRRSILDRVDLKGAIVTGAKNLHEARWQNANFEDVKGLLGKEFSRADLTGVKLPQEIDEFRIINILDETLRNARKILLLLLVGCAYSLLTIATTTDIRLLTNSSSSPLPIIGTNIPIAWFYWFAPIILVMCYIYLHFYLRRVWEGFADLPARFPDGKRLDQRVYPWIVNGIVRRYFELLKVDRTIFNKCEEWVSIFLVWYALPVSLVFFWLRYIIRREWIGTGIHIFLIGFTSFIAVGFYREMVRILRGNVGESFDRKKFYKDGRTIQFGGVLLLVVFLLGLSFGTIDGVRNNFVLTDVRTWAFRFFGTFFRYDVFADLGGEEVSKKPENYWQLAVEERNKAVQGADLRNSDLHNAYISHAFLVKANFGNANLERAIFWGSNLEEAILIADLVQADLSGSNLRRARLINANLWKARLIGVDSSEAEFDLANLISADLKKANLSGAKMFESYLCAANLEEANLKDAFLENSLLEKANLNKANLEGANLKNANLGGSLLEKTNLKGANLDGANLKDANLKGAILQGADLTNVKGLRKKQIESALVDRTTKLPRYFKDSTDFSDVYLHPSLLLCPEKDDGIIRKILR